MHGTRKSFIAGKLVSNGLLLLEMRNMDNHLRKRKFRVRVHTSSETGIHQLDDCSESPSKIKYEGVGLGGGVGEIVHLNSALLWLMCDPGSSLVPTALKEALVL